MLVLDIGVGGTAEFLFFHQRSGKWNRIHRTMSSADQQLFVFGSSHAAQHYVPDVLEAELGLSSFNAGVLGQQILFHKTLQSIVLERLTPKVIVLDVDPSTLYQERGTYERLGDLRPFYALYPDAIWAALSWGGPQEWWFLRSKLYRFNSTFVHVVRYWISPQPDWNGYRPNHGVMSQPTEAQEQREISMGLAFQSGRSLDPMKVDALARFAEDAARRGVSVFYFVSPGAIPGDLRRSGSFREVEAVAARCRVPLFNFRNHPGFLRRYELFADSGHLNDRGSRHYSKLVAEAIRTYLGRANADQRDSGANGSCQAR